MENWRTSEVGAFVHSLGLSSQYETAFVDNDITGDLLAHADHAMLKQLGISSVGHRITILNAIAVKRAADLSANLPTPTQELATLRQDLGPVWQMLDDVRGRPRVDSNKIPTPLSAHPHDYFRKNDSTLMPGSPNDSNVGVIRINLESIGRNEIKPFRVSDTDTADKVLLGILKKYSVLESTASFMFCVRNSDGTDRRLNSDDKPLLLQQKHNQTLPSPTTPSSATSSNHLIFYIKRNSPPSPTPSSPTTAKRPPTLPDPATSTTSSKVYIAVFNYKPARADELPVTIGDTFIVLKKDRDWVTVNRVGGDSVGWIPRGCLKLEDEVLKSGGSAGTPGVGVDAEFPVLVVMLYDYDGEAAVSAGNGVGVKVKAGSLVTVLKKEKQWLYGKIVSTDRKGWIPDSYVSVVNREIIEEKKLANLVGHFDRSLSDEAKIDEKHIHLESGKSVNLVSLIETVNVGLGRWVELEDRDVSTFRGNREAILDKLSAGLNWISFLSGKIEVIRNSSHVEEIVESILNASDSCRMCGTMANADEDRQLDIVYSGLKKAVRLLE
ncbi:Adaptor for signal transduction [Rhizoclosmatium sp. JEL0117]|nr:Adaptor for signal transduction [Rhizoclosmatium sp. JEL0117]